MCAKNEFDWGCSTAIGSFKSFDDCEIPVRDAIRTTVILATSLYPRIVKTRWINSCLHLVLFIEKIILLPLEGHKVFAAHVGFLGNVLLVDLFFVDCVIFHQYLSTDSTDKFHDIHSIHECLWCFYAFSL